MAINKPSRFSGPRKSTQKNNTYVTKSGKTIKLHSSLSDRMRAGRDMKAVKKAERLRGMPKSRVRRFMYKMHPKRLAAFWFSREGGIMALKITGIGIVAMFILMVGVFAYFRKDLPNLRDISGNNIGGSIRYYDRTGKVLLYEDYDAVKRIPVQGDKISNHLKQATIAVEDRDFYKHGGFDTKGITRAAWTNLRGGTNTQGGSTITQQLVKLSQAWTDERTYTRKVKELILAVELERSYSKEEILTGYLNTAPYGNIQYGAEVAAQDYFQKPASKLTLEESVFLAAIPQAPSFYSPYGAYYKDKNPNGISGKEAVTFRMHYTLDVMTDMGFITPEQRDASKKVDVLKTVKRPENKYVGIKAPHFVQTAKQVLEREYSADTVMRSGWKVTTTLDLGLQEIAEDEVKKGITQVQRQGGNAAAMVTEDVETGQIVAMVGGPDFNNKTFGQNNYATTPLPPGSSVKPYDYAALIEHSNNVGAGTVIYDTKAALPGYPCEKKQSPKNGGDCLHDYDLRFPGPVTVRYALGGSRNVPAVKAMLMVGVDKTIETFEKIMNASNENSFGYNCYLPQAKEFIAENEYQCGGSAAIGDGAYLKMDEHVHGLATLARNGLSVPRTYILKIEDSANKTIKEWKLEGGTQAVRPDTAYIISDMLSDPRASYFSRKIHDFNGGKGNWDFAIKTGTTNDAKDGWLTGYSTKYATAVWVGYHNRTREMSGFMENMTRPIWLGFMERAHQGKEAKPFTKPAGVIKAPAYVIRSHVGTGSIEPSPAEDLYPSWYKKKGDTVQRRTIDIISGKLATECTPELAKRVESGGTASQFSGDTFVGGNTTTSNETDDVHKCTDERPSVSVSVSGGGGEYTLRANASPGTHPLSSADRPGIVNFKVNGQTISGGSVSISQAASGVTYRPSESGNATVTAEVIDSVLYSSSSNPVTVTLTSSENTITLDPPVGSLGTYNFSWSGGEGKVSIFNTSGGPKICDSNGNSCGGNTTPGSSVYAKDEDDNISNTVTVP